MDDVTPIHILEVHSGELGTVKAIGNDIVYAEGPHSDDLVPRDVNFIDYDGTLLYSYDASEFRSLYDMPANPTRSGLVSQGWNWTMAEILFYISAYSNTPVWVGQQYLPRNGDTEIVLHLTESDRSLSLYLAIDGLLQIDWGDGSLISETAGTSLSESMYVPHIYDHPGDYTIRLHSTDGAYRLKGDGNSGFVNYYISGEGPVGYRNSAGFCVKSVRLGTSCDISEYAMSWMGNLESIIVPNGIQVLPDYAIFSSSSLKALVIPRSVTELPSYILAYCDSLERLSLPGTLTGIGANSFAHCHILKDLSLAEGLTTLGGYAFSDCASLEHLTLPRTLRNAGSHICQDCPRLSTLHIPDDLRSVGSNAFDGCWQLEQIHISSEMSSISASFAQNARKLRQVYIPEGVTEIGANAFNGCYFLDAPELPDGLTTIGAGAFRQCYNFRSVTIPSSVYSIGGNAFDGCRNVREYHFLSKRAPSFGSGVFNGIDTHRCAIFVPYSYDHSILNEYRSASNISAYAGMMREE